MDIGIIGGADGPTAIIVSSDPIQYVIVTLVVACIIVVGLILLKRRKSMKK